jgi:hypothetical protein
MEGPFMNAVLRRRPEARASAGAIALVRKIGVTSWPVVALRTTVRLSAGSSSITEQLARPK